jgi:hypothetical protein
MVCLVSDLIEGVLSVAQRRLVPQTRRQDTQRRTVLPRGAVGNILAEQSLGGDEISILEARIRHQNRSLGNQRYN